MFIVQQQELLFKDEIARMVKDSEGNVRYLIDSIHHCSELRKKMAEKAHAKFKLLHFLSSATT
jgi:hypothetical protein